MFLIYVSHVPYWVMLCTQSFLTFSRPLWVFCNLCSSHCNKLFSKILTGVLNVGIFFRGGAFDFYIRTLTIVRLPWLLFKAKSTSAKYAPFSVAIMLWVIIIILWPLRTHNVLCLMKMVCVHVCYCHYFRTLNKQISEDIVGMKFSNPHLNQ